MAGGFRRHVCSAGVSGGDPNFPNAGAPRVAAAAPAVDTRLSPFRAVY